MVVLITRHIHDFQFKITSLALASAMHDFIYQKELSIVISTNRLSNTKIRESS